MKRNFESIRKDGIKKMEEIDVKELIETSWKKKKIIIIITIVCAIVGVIKYFTIDSKETDTSINKTYCAEASFIVGVSNNYNITYSKEENIEEDTSTFVTTAAYSKIKVDDNLLSTYQDLLKTQSSLTNVINNLSLNKSVEEIKSNITLLQNEDSNVLTIRFLFDDEEKILDVTNEIVKEFSNTIEKVYVVDKITILDEAHLVAYKSVEKVEQLKSFIKNVCVAVIFGFIISIGLILTQEILDETIKDDEIIEKDLNIPILAKIDKDEKSEQEYFSMTLPNLSKFKTILITSPEMDDGKTYISYNLAKSFVKFKKKVLLMDISSNESELTTQDNRKGLIEYINSKDKTIEKYIQKTDTVNLNVLLLGEDNGKYFEESQIKDILKQLEKEYDEIIIDSKSLLNNVNTLIFSKLVSGTILVAKERKTKIETYSKSKNAINEVKGNIIGSILIK